MALTVTDDTIVRLLVRRGANSDRKKIVLANGELGFADSPTGQERLFVGTQDSTLKGGIPAGVYYHGTKTTFNLAGSIQNLYPGDLFKLTANGTAAKPLGLYALKDGKTGTADSDWEFLGFDIDNLAGDTLKFNPDGTLAVNVESFIEDGVGFTVLPSRNVFGTGETGTNGKALLQFDKRFVSLSADVVGAGHFHIGNNSTNTFDINYRMELDGAIKVNTEIAADGVLAIPPRHTWQIGGVEYHRMTGTIKGLGLDIENPLNVETTFHVGSAKEVTLDSKRYVQYIDGYGSDDGGLLIRTADTNGDQFGIKVINDVGTNIFSVASKTGNSYIGGTLGIKGDTEAEGDVVAYGSVTTPSDITLKKNIKPLENSLDKILKLNGVTYDWKKKAPSNSPDHQVGVIAQDVEEVLPEAVKEFKGIKTVDYGKLVPLLIESIKELNKKLEAYGDA